MTISQQDLTFILKMRDQASKQFQKFGQTLNSTNKEIKQTGLNLETATKAAGEFAAAWAGIQASLGTFRTVMGNFSQVEDIMVGVAKTTGWTSEQMAGFNKSFGEMAKSMGVPLSQLGEAAEVAGQIGIKAEQDVLRFTKVIAQLGVASDVQGEKAAQSVARLLNVTGEGVDKVEEFASALVYAGNNAAATEGQILRMASELARSTSGMGLMSHQILAISTGLTEMGQSAELSGTAIGRIMRTLVTHTVEGSSAVKQLAADAGLSMEEFSRMVKESPVDALIVFADAFKKVNDETGLTKQFLAQFSLQQEETLKIMGPLSENTARMAELTGSLGKAYVEANHHVEEARVASQKLSSQYARLKNSFTVLTAQIGSDFAPTVKGVVTALTEMIDVVSDVYGELGPVTQTFISHAIMLGPPIIAAVAAFKALTSAMAILGVTTTAVTGKMAGFMALLTRTPLGAVALAIVAADFAYRQFTKSSAEAAEAQDEVNKALEEAPGLFENFKDKTEDERQKVLHEAIREMEGLEATLNAALRQREALTARLQAAQTEQAKDPELVQALEQTKKVIDETSQSLAELKQGYDAAITSQQRMAGGAGNIQGFSGGGAGGSEDDTPPGQKYPEPDYAAERERNRQDWEQSIAAKEQAEARLTELTRAGELARAQIKAEASASARAQLQVRMQEEVMAYQQKLATIREMEAQYANPQQLHAAIESVTAAHHARLLDLQRQYLDREREQRQNANQTLEDMIRAHEDRIAQIKGDNLTLIENKYRDSMERIKELAASGADAEVVARAEATARQIYEMEKAEARRNKMADAGINAANAQKKAELELAEAIRQTGDAAASASTRSSSGSSGGSSGGGSKYGNATAVYSVFNPNYYMQKKGREFIANQEGSRKEISENIRIAKKRLKDLQRTGFGGFATKRDIDNYYQRLGETIRKQKQAERDAAQLQERLSEQVLQEKGDDLALLAREHKRTMDRIKQMEEDGASAASIASAKATAKKLYDMKRLQAEKEKMETNQNNIYPEGVWVNGQYLAFGTHHKPGQVVNGNDLSSMPGAMDVQQVLANLGGGLGTLGANVLSQYKQGSGGFSGGFGGLPSITGGSSMFRYAEGGIAGHPPGTVPAFLERNTEAAVPLKNGRIPVEFKEEGSRNLRVEIHVHAKDADSFTRSRYQVKRDLANAVRDGLRA